MFTRPNVVLLLVDQLRACSLSLYGDSQVPTPNIERLARQGLTLDNMIATCPVCTPFRSMMITGRHPQTTGHLINFVRTRHDEIGIGDAFSHAGYRTGYVGKWHLHTGCFPQIIGRDYVPEGRDRLGFQHWRGYNFHAQYINGWVNRDDWRVEAWKGYETHALNRYAFEFMGSVGDDPFFLIVSPHQPHQTHACEHAPQEYYERLPKTLTLPPNVPEHMKEKSLEMYRHYMAMTLAVDDMLGEIMDWLDDSGKAKDTILIFASDHGTQAGSQGIEPWMKMRPFEESLRVPLVARWPGVLEAGRRCDALTGPVDLFPTLCGLCGVPVPRTVEGFDLSGAWKGEAGAFEQDALLTMNFTATFDYILDGKEWRGARTKAHSYAKWLDGRTELFDLKSDPWEMTNLAGKPEAAKIEAELDGRLRLLMAGRNDALVPCSTYRNWYDAQRRVVRNAHGPLGHPEDEPDWSLLR